MGIKKTDLKKKTALKQRLKPKPVTKTAKSGSLATSKPKRKRGAVRGKPTGRPLPDALKDHAWKPGQSGNPAGRPKKIYTILKKTGYSKDDVKTAFSELGWYDLADIKKASEDKKLPMIVRIVAKAFIKAYDDCDYYKIREIMQHTIGMPKQDIGIVDREITGITFDD
jgi:hypothetical protein